MRLPEPHPDPAPRGQALVEFALILPILALLLLLAVDFGRVFFGWVALNNATRIAANYAALDPGAWVVPIDAEAQAEYRQQVINDMQAINCAPPGGGAWDPADIPDPVFKDAGGTADAHEVGDHATVVLECGFTFLTPLIGSVVGNPMTIGAQSAFPIRGGLIAGIPLSSAVPASNEPPATPAPCTVPQLVGLRTNAGQTAWTLAGFTGEYLIQRPPSGNYIITAQSLVGGQAYPCNTSVTVSRP